MGLLQALKEEFHCRNIALSHASRQAFLGGQWHYQTPFVLYRVTVAAYTLFAYIYNYVAFGAYDGQGRMLLVYLTVLTYTVLAAHLTLAAAIVVLGYRQHGAADSYSTSSISDTRVRALFVSAGQPGERDWARRVSGSTDDWHLPWYMKLDWLLFDIVIVASPIITAVYFAALPKPQNPTTMQMLVDYSMHASNTIIAVLEVLLSAIPVRLFHCLYPMMYMIMYVVFNTIFWALDERRNVIYPNVLDWNHPVPTCITIAGVTAVIPLLNLILFLMYQARLRLSSSCGSNAIDGQGTVDAIALSGNRGNR